jgi:uncharacterized membrane protein YraQ (UPF0718 family)/copper chaperone CopZ
MGTFLDFTREFGQAFWLVTAQMAPWLLLGFLIAGLLSVYVSPRWLERHLGGRGMGPVFKASLLGVPLPLCSCGVIPVAASLRRHGASPAATTAFLISTPQTGVDSIAVTGALLGPVFAVFRPVAALLTGVLGGGVVQVLEGREATVTDGAEASDAPPRGNRLRAALDYGLVTLPRDIGRALLVGLALAAVIAAVVPPGSLGGLLGGGVWPVLVMMVVGIPLYVCATGSVPLAAGFIHAGVSPGPATNAATVTTLLRVLGKRVTVVYLATVAVSAFAGGLAVDAIAGVVDLRLPMAEGLHHHEHMELLDHVWALLLVAVMVRALWPCRGAGTCCGGDDDTCHPTTENTAMQTIALNVDGMNCSHCSASVERALREQPGVRDVVVSLDESRATVTGEGLDAAALAAAVTALGYSATVA